MQRLCEACELSVVANGDDDMSVADGERLVRHDVRMGVAVAAGRFSRREEVHALVGQSGDLDIEQGQINMLSVVADISFVQSR